MPNPILPEERRCIAHNANGKRCGGVKLKGADTCFAHSPTLAREEAQDCHFKPSDSLATLARLNFTDPSNISRLRVGLIEHIMDGSILANAAAQVVKLAELELAASTTTKTDPLASAISAVVATTPPKQDD